MSIFICWNPAVVSIQLSHIALSVPAPNARALAVAAARPPPPAFREILRGNPWFLHPNPWVSGRFSTKNYNSGRMKFSVSWQRSDQKLLGLEYGTSSWGFSQATFLTEGHHLRWHSCWEIQCVAPVAPIRSLPTTGEFVLCVQETH